MLLATYLNDHLAGATAGLELARRSAANNRGSALGPYLANLAQEIDEDRDALLTLMSDLDIGTDRIKVFGGRAVEKLARLKPNGRLLSYSPLSRLLELEGLMLGVRGKLALGRDPRIWFQASAAPMSAQTAAMISPSCIPAVNSSA